MGGHRRFSSQALLPIRPGQRNRAQGEFRFWQTTVSAAPGQMRRAILQSTIAALLLLAQAAFSADQIPPAPTRYFTQYTQLVSPATADALNRKLEEFEKKTSSQILVVIFPKLPERAALEDFTIRAAQAWRVGQKSKDNGAILFIFVADRKIRIEVGYGLEGAIPDAVAKRIIDEQIRPRFQQRDMEGGIVAGVNALMQAAQGEY